MTVELPVNLPAYMNIKKRRESILSLNYPPAVQKIIKYSGAALGANRSCGNVMIMMAGQSGAGKSTTINKLFNDDDLCSTNTNTSDTGAVWEVEVQCVVNNHKPYLKSSLLFIDVPGALDTVAAKRELHQELIQKYLKTSPYLLPRPTRVLDKLDGQVRHKKKRQDSALKWVNNDGSWMLYQKVYPNLILFVVKGNDKRMVGKNSNLHETLKLLAQLDVVDKTRPNLIVAVTHAILLARNADVYNKRVDQITSDIRALLVEVFELPCMEETKVIFIENDADGQDLEKGKNSDFYVLPDGSLSHLNLINAMTESFEANNDLLGKLLCGWYFGNSCPIKAVPKEKMNLTYLKMTDGEIADAHAQEIDKLNVCSIKELPLHYVAHGYCLTTKTLKSRMVLAECSSTQDVELSEAKFKTHVAFICSKPSIANSSALFTTKMTDTKKKKVPTATLR